MSAPKDLYEQLRRDEGVMREMYVDSAGWLTIGVGHNLRQRPLSDRAIQVILEDDVRDTTTGLMAAHPWVAGLSKVRQEVLINMAFNLGLGGLNSFKRMLVAVQNEQWDKAAAELLDSKFAKQVGDRAQRLARQMAEDVRY